MRWRLFAVVAGALAGAAWVRGRWEDFLLLLPPSRAYRRSLRNRKE